MLEIFALAVRILYKPVLMFSLVMFLVFSL